MTANDQGKEVCAFCGRDPYHWVDIGVGEQAAGVICCPPGMIYYDWRSSPEARRLVDLILKLKRDPRPHAQQRAAKLEKRAFYAD